MKWIVIILLYSSFVFTQDEDPYFQLSTSWELGETRNISKVAIKKIFLDDVLAQETTTSSDYKLSVIDTLLRTTVQFEQVYVSLKSNDIAAIPSQELMQFMIENIELRMQCLPYQLLIDRSSGMAFEVVNTAIYDENIEHVITKSMEDFKPLMQESAEGLNEFKSQLADYLKGSKKNILETVLNELNELLEPYTYSYPLDKTSEKEVVIDRIGTEKEGVGKEVPATLKLDARKNEETLNVSTSLTYDKEAFLEYIKRSNPAFVNVKSGDLNVKEKKEFSADIKSNWVIKYTSEMLTEIPDIRIIQFNSYYFN